MVQISNPYQNYQPNFDFGFQPTQLDPTINTGQFNAMSGAGNAPAWNSFQGMFGGQGSTGWVNPAIQGAAALAQGWLGFQQLDLAKDSLNFQKEAFNKNYENQRMLTNQQLLDRQRARYAANPNAYAAPDAGWQGSNLIRG